MHLFINCYAFTFFLLTSDQGLLHPLTESNRGLANSASESRHHTLRRRGLLRGVGLLRGRRLLRTLAVVRAARGDLVLGAATVTDALASGLRLGAVDLPHGALRCRVVVRGRALLVRTGVNFAVVGNVALFAASLGHDADPTTRALDPADHAHFTVGFGDESRLEVALDNSRGHCLL